MAPLYDEALLASWQSQVLKAYKNRCGNCDVTQHLSVVPIVPFENGGKPLLRNGVVLCRRCGLAQNSPTSSDTPRLINFYVSRSLFTRMETPGFEGNFKSRAELMRFLIGDFVMNPARYDDIANYQDPSDTASSRVKVNVWVTENAYTAFVGASARVPITITSALRALLLIYDENREKTPS